MPQTSSVPSLPAPAALPPELPPAPSSTPPAPWAWAAAVILGQPNAHRLVRAFFVGLIGLTTVLLGGLRGCR